MRDTVLAQRIFTGLGEASRASEGRVAYSQIPEDCQKTSAYSQKTDAFSKGTSKASKGITKSQLGTVKPHRNKKGPEALPRDPAKVLKLLRESFSDDQLSNVLGTQRSAGAFNGCENKPPTNLYRLCNGMSAPSTFKGLRCFTPKRFEAIKELFNASK